MEQAGDSQPGSGFLPRTWPQIILHADMDAFYAAVEQLDNPELRGKPVLIGPNSHRGVVLTASYEARPWGVGSAMPVAEARRKCPQAIMVPPRFERYQAISKLIMDIFHDFSPRVEAISLDEAFIDMTGAEHLFGTPRQMGMRLKTAVLEATGLHISVGVAGTKYVAKVASAHQKPNGLTVVPPETSQQWLAPLPINRLWGVGAKTTPKLQALGLDTIGDLAAMGEATLRAKFGRAGSHYHQLAHGIDPRRVKRQVESSRSAKSIGSDRTLSEDVVQRADIERHLRRSSHRIAVRVREKRFMAGGVRVRLKTSRFQMLTRQMLLAQPADTAESFLAAARTLLDHFDLQRDGPFRLVGMAVFDLRSQQDDSPAQAELFQPQPSRNLETTIDDLAARFGPEVVMRARDLLDPGTVSRNGVNLDFLDEDNDAQA